MPSDSLLDQHEFEALLQPHLSLAFNLAYRTLGSREEAEDVVQNAAIRAWKSLSSYEPGTNFKAWFLRIVVNLALNARRDASRRPATVDLEDEGEEAAGYLYAQTKAAGLQDSSEPANAFLAKVQAEDIQNALAKLPVDFRMVAVLYFVEEMSYEEIANAIGAPLGTVRSRLHRARRLLQKELWETAREMGVAPRDEDGKSSKASLKSLGWIILAMLGTIVGRRVL